MQRSQVDYYLRDGGLEFCRCGQPFHLQMTRVGYGCDTANLVRRRLRVTNAGCNENFIAEPAEF